MTTTTITTRSRTCAGDTTYTEPVPPSVKSSMRASTRPGTQNAPRKDSTEPSSSGSNSARSSRKSSSKSCSSGSSQEVSKLTGLAQPYVIKNTPGHEQLNMLSKVRVGMDRVDRSGLSYKADSRARWALPLPTEISPRTLVDQAIPHASETAQRRGQTKNRAASVRRSSHDHYRNRRLSPKSLRAARLRRLSQMQVTKNSQTMHNKLKHHIKQRPSRSSSNGFERGSETLHFTHTETVPVRAKLERNVEVKLADLSPIQIAGYVARDYVVNILPNTRAQRLPMRSATRSLLNRYVHWGLESTTVGFGPYRQYVSALAHRRWQQWAYISRLYPSEIGNDGRRRSTGSRDFTDEDGTMIWTVVLVPLTAALAEELRERLLADI